MLRPLTRWNGAAPLVLLLSAWLGCGGKATSEEPAGSGPARAPGGASTVPLPPIPEGPIAETCEQNPLLPDCVQPPSAATCPDNPLACPLTPEPPPRRRSSSEPARRSDDESLPYVVRMEALLDEECGSCHGAQARRACVGTCDGMLYIDDMTQLLESEKIIPCNWRDSPVARRVLDGSMPPPTSGLPAMRLAAQQQLAVFVESMCDPLREPDSFRRTVVQQVLLDSCGACHGPVSPADAGGQLPAVDDIDALIDGGYLIPCRSQASPLVSAIQSASMPPPGSGQPPMSAEQLATLINVVDSPCAR